MVAAILATLLILAPVASAATSISYVENGLEAVATFSATDEDGDAIEWSLAGDDAGDFAISDDGVLTFKSKPNFEGPADKNLNNVYLVTVQASSGGQTATEDLEITVTDEDEPGKVTLSQPQPQVGRDLTASLSDVDKPVQDEKWQWARGESADGPWSDIDKATSASRSPVAADDGMYLQATVVYEDKFGTGKTVSAVTESSVEAKTKANAAPSFAHLDTDTSTADVADVNRAVDEGKKGVNVGKPVMARDADGDVLLYSIAAAGTMHGGGAGDSDTDVTNLTDLFSIDPRSGQLKTKVDSLDSDDSGTTGATADANGEARYTITVTATDPSGAPGTAMVTVTITDINDAPKITAADSGAGNRKALTVAENVDTSDTTGDLDADTATTATGIQDPTYTATDDDAGDVITNGDANASPPTVNITYAVEGADKGVFRLIDDAGVQTLAFKTDHEVNYEKQKEYSISIVARDDSAPEGVATLDVTVTVTNEEDPGKIELSQLEPQIGTAVIARLTDEDGSVRNPSWQWQRADAAQGSGECSTLTSDATSDVGWVPITGENSPSYTPKAADMADANNDDTADPRCLRAVVTYTDALDSDNDGDDTIDSDDMDSAAAVTVRDVQAENPANSAPNFEDDQDVNTPGDQGDAERSVEENDSGANVGDPVTALPVDGDLLMYTLSGDDAGSFKINRESGQITTAEKLDYEMKDSYMVVVTATDPSSATDTIDVNIEVLDVNDKPVISITESNAVSYAENGLEAVATFSATDEDGDAIEWSLAGDDAGDFAISDDGVLTFKSKPNFEGPADKNLNNVYLVMVQASSGGQTATEDLEITVTDEDEPGKVTLSQPQPQVSRDLTASLSDVDKPVQDEKWQWSRGESADGPWSDIDKATSASRSPVAADDGMYLQATVVYEDKFGTGKTVSAVTESSVEDKTRANAAPSFAHLDTDTSTADVADVNRAVDEGKKGVNVGKPVMARDADGDVLLYSIAAAGTMDDGEGTDDTDVTNLTDLFSIDPRSGQLSTKVDSLNSDDSGTTGATADANGEVSYTITVTATDPSGAPGTAMVTVTITDINDAPKITAADSGAGNRKALTVAENVDTSDTTGDLDANPDTDGIQDPTFVALDADDGDVNAGDDSEATTTVPATVRLKYSVEGADKGVFQLSSTTSDNDTTGVTLSFKTDHKVNYEKQKEYSISIVARDDSAPEGVATLDVTVTVTNEEDDGTVELSQLEPQIGTAVIARLTDEDGSVRNPSWQWQRAAAALGANEECETSTAISWGDIIGENSPSYTPKAADIPVNNDGDDEPRCLRAMVTYTDALDSDNDGDNDVDADDMDTAVAITVRDVQPENPANSAPNFEDDQDVNTPGDQADAERSVEENDSGANVGDPVTALPVDGDLLLYTLSGDDAGSFKIDRESGQITTAMKLDYETKDSYMVVVTATDPSGATDTIDVNISVLDVNDKPVIALGAAENTAPAFTAATATRSVDENMYAGADVGEPVTAMDDDAGDTVTYELTGSTYFEIDGDGQITTTMMLDHEAMSTHAVTVTATDSAGESDSVDVTINVDNTHTGCDTAGNMGLVNDCEALLDSKDALGGSVNWAALPMSDWDGVTMSGDPMRVTAINLRDQGLDGTIPGALGRLSALTSLNLRSNADLSGEIPGSLNYLSNLTVLNLHSNSHTGDIPDLSGTMLNMLILPSNELTGSVPAWLNTMTDMTELWLWGNQLAGALPDLNGMTSLEILKLNGNMVSGFDAAMLPSGLRWLVAGETDMGSTAPDLSSLMSLTTLWMNENGLTGAVPVANIPASVTSLNLKGNALSGTIPDMSSLNNLRYLRLHRNELSGDIPGTLGDLDSIERIWLYENDLTGISAGLDNASDTLTHLYLNGNSFAEGTCLPGDLAMVENNDFEMAGLAACGDGS